VRRWTAWNKMFGGALYKGIAEPAEEEEDTRDLKGGL
jgi:hypothetical protein